MDSKQSIIKGLPCNVILNSPGGTIVGYICLFFFVLRFYGPVKTIKVMSSRSVNISTLFPGRLPKSLTSIKCKYFCQ